MARKQGSRSISANVKIKMEGRPPPDEDSTSLPHLLQDFPSLNIGARKKENFDLCTEYALTSHIKEDEVSLEDDRDFEDVCEFENWTPQDRVVIDGSESSEWGRSISSSMSWFDESEQEAALKVKDMMDNIENMLYGESHTPLPKILVEECQQWKLRFPHLRVVGTRILKSPCERHEENLSSNDEDISSEKKEKMDYTRKNVEEDIGDEEEVYASHGDFAAETELLPHDFIKLESLGDNNGEKLKDSLLNEMASHIWKEVIIPSFNSYLENNIMPKEHGAWYSFEDKWESLGAFTMKNRQNAEDEQVGVVPLKPYSDKPSASCSLTETMPIMEVLYEPDDPFECYKRYSEQLTYCRSSKLSSMFVSSEIKKEIGQDITVEKECKISRKNPSKSGSKGICASITCNNELREKELTKNSPPERRLQFFSERRLRRTGIVDDLMPLEKSNPKFGSGNEVLSPPKESLTSNHKRHLTLPAIEQSVTSPNTEVCNVFCGRSSSALPKLASKTFRPILSSYQGRVDKNATTKKSLKYNEVDPLKLDEVHWPSCISHSSARNDIDMFYFGVPKNTTFQYFKTSGRERV